MSAFEAVIGLEVHVQLRTRSKLFCACPNAYGLPPNSATCPVCLGLPGTLPVLNREAVAQALRLGRALEATLRPRSDFYRKQYFYADLPKGYQITQGPVALVEGGALRFAGDPAVRGQAGTIACGITRAHLEEDAGKSHHDLQPGATLVDLNRAGVPLVEIVGEPDLRSPLEAMSYLQALHRVVVFLGICDGNLEEGSFRCDANLSLRPAGAAAFGTRVEIKNLNSFNNVRRALAFEMERHRALLEAGQAVVAETRGWDADRGETRVQRAKERAHDYRFFPEPDLPALVVDPADFDLDFPELPEAKAARYQAEAGLAEAEALTLLQSPAFSAYYEAVAQAAAPKAAAAWMLGEVSRLLNERNQSIEAFPVPATSLGALVALVESKALSLATAKEKVLPALLAGERDPAAFVKAQGVGQVSDASTIRELVETVLTANPEPVAQLKAGGKASLRGFLVGQVMKAGQGRLDPRLVNEVLDEALAR